MGDTTPLHVSFYDLVVDMVGNGDLVPLDLVEKFEVIVNEYGADGAVDRIVDLSCDWLGACIDDVEELREWLREEVEQRV